MVNGIMEQGRGPGETTGPNDGRRANRGVYTAGI